MVLPSFYLPPVSWFVRLLQSNEPVYVEQWANYRKQRLHNRCWIDSPNGRLSLTVPVDRANFIGGKCLMKDVQISDHNDWQHQHWYALESSYFNSPFFEYMQDDFRPIYNKRWKWLMDLNEALVGKCMETLSLPIPLKGRGEVTETSEKFTISRTMEFMGPDDCAQHSEFPKFQISGVPEYYQVFSAKHGFLQDLSIIDLIFNLGPESLIYLYDLARKTN